LLRPILSLHHTIELDEYEVYGGANEQEETMMLTANNHDLILDNNTNNNNKKKNADQNGMIDLSCDCEKFNGMSLFLKRKSFFI
jgi:hypothetical protein